MLKNDTALNNVNLVDCDKLTILTITYYLASAICEPIADTKIVNLLGSVADTFKTLLAIVFCVTVVLIVGLTIVIKISNATLLYR